MFLFFFVTILTFLNAFASRITSFILTLINYDKSVYFISGQISELKKEQSTISMQSEFAKYAKLQRRINKLLDEKQNLIAEHSAKISKFKYFSLFVIYGVIAITFLVLVWMFKRETIAQLPAEWLWPFPNMFSWFSATPGSISISSWIVISSAATKIIAKSF